MTRPYGEVLDEMDHQAKYQSATDSRRGQELRIQALGAALSHRDWHATEKAYNAIRDAFYHIPATCPKCRRTRHDFDCAEGACPMAALTSGIRHDP